MAKKKNTIICAICTFIVSVCIAGVFPATSASSESSISAASIANMVTANNGYIFMVGGSEETEMPKTSDVIKSLKEQLLASSIYARSNIEMSVNDSTRIEFINQFGYCEPQTITVYEDTSSTTAKLMFERPYKDGKVGYFIYEFDKLDTYNRAEDFDDRIIEFNCNGFDYIIFVKNEQYGQYSIPKFCLAKKV